MRRLLYLVGLLAFSGNGFAQCNEFYQLQEGNEWEMESYNAKGKLTGKNHQKVISYEGQANSFVATVHSVMSDKKGKEVMNGDMHFKCEDGTMLVDMRNFLSEEQMAAFQNYELQIEGENMEIPNNLSIGQTLKPSSVTVTATNAPMAMEMHIEITDRKVEGKETVKTPAGTFECFKITSNTTVKTRMAIGMTVEFSTIEWLAPKVAVVRSESFRKGKLQGFSILTKRN